jgi:hypothetical protein
MAETLSMTKQTSATDSQQSGQAATAASSGGGNSGKKQSDGGREPGKAHLAKGMFALNVKASC